MTYLKEALCFFKKVLYPDRRGAIWVPFDFSEVREELIARLGVKYWNKL